MVCAKFCMLLNTVHNHLGKLTNGGKLTIKHTKLDFLVECFLQATIWQDTFNNELFWWLE